MTTRIKLCLANSEVQLLLQMRLNGKTSFYEEVMKKITLLLRRCQNEEVYPLVTLAKIQTAIQALNSQFYDRVDIYEGLLEKKKHLQGLALRFPARFFPEVSFDSSIAADLVALFTVYDRLLSTLKALRVASCFIKDKDYYSHLRRNIKAVNKLLSDIKLISLQNLPTVTINELLDGSLPSFLSKSIDYSLLHKAIHSNLAARLKEHRRLTLLARLKKEIQTEKET